jgi:hypothetical protein
MRSRTETEMAFMGMLKVSSVKSPASARASSKSFSGNCRGKVLEKFESFSDTTWIMRVSHSGERRPPA